MPGTVLGPEDAEMNRGTPVLMLTPHHPAGSHVGKSEPQQCAEFCQKAGEHRKAALHFAGNGKKPFPKVGGILTKSEGSVGVCQMHNVTKDISRRERSACQRQL